MGHNSSVSIVIPALNEEKEVGKTVSSIFNLFAQNGLELPEIIVVNDGSSDATAANAQKAGARVINHPHNVGYGASLKDGIRSAKNDTIVICDADGTYPIDAIPELLTAYAEGFHMVVGARQGKHYHQSFLKKRLRQILRWMVEFISGRVIPDINSGLRVFSRKTVLPFFPRLCDTFSFTTSMTLALMMTSHFVKYIPIDYHERVGTTKVRLVRDSLRTLQFLVEATIYYNPLKIFMVFSGLLFLISIPGFCISAFLGLRIGYLVGIGSILLAFLMFGIGLLAVLLKQIMHASCYTSIDNE